MGSLGTPGPQPRKLLENALEMSLDPGNVSDPGKRAASLLETNPEIPWKTGRPRLYHEYYHGNTWRQAQKLLEKSPGRTLI